MAFLGVFRYLTWKKRRKYRMFIPLVMITVIILVYKHRRKIERDRILALKRHRAMEIEQSDILYNVIRSRAEIRDQTCIHPLLDTNQSSVSKFFHDVPNLECNNEDNWIMVENGSFFITEEAKTKHGAINCQYVPIFRGDDDYKIKNGKKESFQSGYIRSPTDFFKISCKGKDGSRYFNIHATVHATQQTIKSDGNVTQAGGIPLNILMFGYDSVSRNTWKRKLPKSHDYFVNTLGGMLLEGYNIVGDGTPQALLPILTGKSETELPESRRGKPNAKSVDNYPWIWKDFQQAGYVTQWAEDMAHIGTFNLRMLGFQNQPVDHYMRPFYLSAEKMYSFNKPYCLGSQSRHSVMLNWFRDTFTMYSKKRKFMFGFHSEFSHKDSNNLQWADEDLLRFLTFLHENKYLNNTLVILMSDHGARFHEIRKTVQGKYEERMPYFGFRFPDWFANQYPSSYNKFTENTQRLTTPFDIHATFLDILGVKGNSSFDRSKKTQKGISLFKRIPKDRSCNEAGIPSHWCACLKWNPLPTSSMAVQRAAKAFIKFINSLTKPYRQKCHYLILNNIINAFSITENIDIAKYRGSWDADGRLANFSNNVPPQNSLYQITVVTSPGNGMFEATVKYTARTDDFRVNNREISRINSYGNSAYCIMNAAPHLRQYCSCIG